MSELKRYELEYDSDGEWWNTLEKCYNGYLSLCHKGMCEYFDVPDVPRLDLVVYDKPGKNCIKVAVDPQIIVHVEGKPVHATYDVVCMTRAILLTHRLKTIYVGLEY